MGEFINPKNDSKEHWLHTNAASIIAPHTVARYDERPGQRYVCLAHGDPSVATVATDQRALKELLRDGQQCQWFSVPIEKLNEV